jgi:hypothetical protein
MDDDRASAVWLMTRLFVRRLVQNDLISPHADRQESLALTYAMVASLGVFLTFFLSISYLAAFIQLPGVAALSALSDRFLFIGASIAISALAALMTWDALAIEPRDAAILGPLPVPGRAIARAKLAAAVMFGALLTLAFNAVPSVLYPLFLTLNIRGTAAATILSLIAGHAATVTAAGMLGFSCILASRGMLRLAVGEQGFQRSSSAVQSALVVAMVTALLLTLTVRANDVRAWIGGAATPPTAVRPVLWYLAANETLAGHRVAETPIVLPPLLAPGDVPRDRDEWARARYRELLPRFAPLAERAWVSLPVVTGLAIVAFLWTNRRLPERSAGVARPSRLRTVIHGIAERLTGRDPEAQAGFFFALQTLMRSSAHRTVLAIAVAVGLTHALIVLARNIRHAIEITVPGLAIAVLLVLSLLAGIAHAVNVPAAPAANWIIRMAWLGDERRYLAGVKHAAMLLAVMLLALLLPVHGALFGPGIAVLHSLLVLLLAVAALDLILLSYRKLPFACGYVPLENPKIVWPAALLALLLVSYGFANAERWALQTPVRSLVFAVALGASVVLARVADRAERRERRPMDFDGRPRPMTQRLGLQDHIAMND